MWPGRLTNSTQLRINPYHAYSQQPILTTDGLEATPAMRTRCKTSTIDKLIEIN